MAFFNSDRRLKQLLKPVVMAGLGYMRLGQPVSTLSGGESQRLKLVTELSKARRPEDLRVFFFSTTAGLAEGFSHGSS